ncbi:MAG: hypothetical protein K2I46_04355 [Clostridia bacterium]|nr:hypothetical protein [Clostridia bacterium]
MKKKLVLSISVVLLLVMVVVACVACTPNADKVEKKLKDKGYSVNVEDISADGSGQYASLGVTKVLSASKSEDDYVIVLWFKDSDKLNEAYEKAKAEFDEWKQAYEEMGGEFNMKLVKKGKAIVQGSANAVKLVG